MSGVVATHHHHHHHHAHHHSPYSVPSYEQSYGSRSPQEVNDGQSPVMSPEGSTPISSTGGSTNSQVVRRRKTPSSWDPHDDLLLRHLKEQQKLGWKEIAVHFPNRTTNACQFRWRRLVSGTLRSAPHSPQATPAAPPPQMPAMNTSAPPPAATVLPPAPGRSNSTGHIAMHLPASAHSAGWTSEQDDLIVRRKDLRVEELALLLGRDERDIQMRAAVLTAPPTPSATGDSASDTSMSPGPSPLSPQPPSVSSSTTVNTPTPATNANGASTPRPWINSRRCSYFEGLRLPVPVPQRPKANQSSVVLPPLTPPLHGL
jgi:hypothetical protein